MVMKEGESYVKIVEDPMGDGWILTLTCPMPGCGARGTASGESRSGPFWGACRRGHTLTVPTFP